MLTQEYAQVLKVNNKMWPSAYMPLFTIKKANIRNPEGVIQYTLNPRERFDKKVNSKDL